LTAADSLRLWLVAKPDGDRERPASPEATAAARIEPSVTLPVEQHVETVYRYALRLTRRPDLAEDLAQETLLRGWRDQAKLREVRAARVWLLRIATNLWTDQLRNTRNQPNALEADPPCPRRQPGDLGDQREQVRMALAAMDELPPRQRQILYLATCEELTNAEIAEVLGVSDATVKSNLSLARKEMRRRLKEVYAEVCCRPACKEHERDP
jgi:RNA polymerase sigma-70 factor, ECF subfamily